MIGLQYVLEVINEIVVLPVAVVTFFLLIYIVAFIWKKDPDVVRSRIFLKYLEFKKAFILLAVFAFVLMLHVSLIYIPHWFSFDSPLIDDAQRAFGLILVLILIAFTYLIIRNIRNQNIFEQMQQ